MAADQGNARLRVTFKTHVFSLQCDLKASHTVISANQSFFVPQTSLVFTTMGFGLDLLYQLIIYTVKKKRIMIISASIF